MKEALEASTLEIEVIGPLKDNNHFQTKDFKDRETEIKIVIAVGHSIIITSTALLEEELVPTLINQEGTLAVDLIPAQMLVGSINITCMSNKESNMAPMQSMWRLQSLPKTLL